MNKENCCKCEKEISSVEKDINEGMCCNCSFEYLISKKENEYKKILDKIYHVADSFEWHYKNEDTSEGYVSKLVNEYWRNK